MRSLWASFASGAALLLLGAGCSVSPVAFSPKEEVPSVPQESSPSSAAAQEGDQQPMQTWTFQGVLPADRIENKQVRITTTYGDIVIRLFPETAPVTVSNFIYLAEGGYYNGLTFHRREEGFVIQGGDPRGNGTGGPGYAFDDEVDDDYTYKRGIVAMANAGVRGGRGTNGSQFFVMLDDVPLPKAYSIFGEVVSGMEVVDRIKVGDVMQTVVVEDAE